VKVVTALLLAASSLHSQQNPVAVFPSRVPLVTVDAVVQDDAGRLRLELTS